LAPIHSAALAVAAKVSVVVTISSPGLRPGGEVGGLERGGCRWPTADGVA